MLIGRSDFASGRSSQCRFARTSGGDLSRLTGTHHDRDHEEKLHARGNRAEKHAFNDKDNIVNHKAKKTKDTTVTTVVKVLTSAVRTSS